MASETDQGPGNVRWIKVISKVLHEGLGSRAYRVWGSGFGVRRCPYMHTPLKTPRSWDPESANFPKVLRQSFRHASEPRLQGLGYEGVGFRV